MISVENFNGQCREFQCRCKELQCTLSETSMYTFGNFNGLPPASFHIHFGILKLIMNSLFGVMVLCTFI